MRLTAARQQHIADERSGGALALRTSHPHNRGRTVGEEECGLRGDQLPGTCCLLERLQSRRDARRLDNDIVVEEVCQVIAPQVKPNMGISANRLLERSAQLTECSLVC